MLEYFDLFVTPSRSLEKYLGMILVSPKYIGNEKYNHGIKEYAVDIINEIISLRRKIISESEIDKKFIGELKQSIDDLVAIGMAPSSINALEAYLKSRICQLITTENIEIYEPVSSEILPYHLSGKSKKFIYIYLNLDTKAK